jgi:hypothetical protein
MRWFAITEIVWCGSGMGHGYRDKHKNTIINSIRYKLRAVYLTFSIVAILGVVPLDVVIFFNIRRVTTFFLFYLFYSVFASVCKTTMVFVMQATLFIHRYLAFLKKCSLLILLIILAQARCNGASNEPQ